MRHISARNLLMKKLYGEISNWENELLHSETNKNWRLLEDLESFKEVVNKLNSEIYSPSRTSIRIILEHSRKTAPAEISC